MGCFTNRYLMFLTELFILKLKFLLFKKLYYLNASKFENLLSYSSLIDFRVIFTRKDYLLSQSIQWLFENSNGTPLLAEDFSMF